jgi:two-component system, sporulation sensor kinase B
MTDFLKNISLLKKTFFFSFFISFFVVATIALFSYYLQSYQLEKQLADHALDVSSLWSKTINPKDVEAVKKTQNESDPHFMLLDSNLSIFNEKNPNFLNGYIIDSKVTNKNKIHVIASAQENKEHGWLSLSAYSAQEDFLEVYDKVLHSKVPFNSKAYSDRDGKWITALSPIINDNGEMIAMFGIDISIESITSFQKENAIMLLLMLIIITPCVFYFLRKGFIKVLDPVNELIYGVNELSKGHFDVQLKVRDHSEIGLLSERFNQLANQLFILVEKLAATSEQFDAHPEKLILHNLDDALDKMQNIMEKSKTHRDLQRAEKMNAIGQLAASVAHEIRNPMTVVKGFLQIFLAKEQMSDEERMYIRLMIDEMNRAETIINDYLSMAKPDMEQTEKIDGKELAVKAMDLMNSYAMMSKNIMMISPIVELIYIKGNKSELQQVLINMLKNGIEAMQDGGQLSLSVYQEGLFGVFEISDTGIGMTKEELKRLGTAFYSLKEKGTGMGLTVCYQIVERMKGKIEVDSEKGIGTTFKIFIPLSD